MVLRAAFLVFSHKVPQSLFINADHTGIMHTQIKGATRITGDMVKANDKSVNDLANKQQFTDLASSAANGEMLQHQVVMQGKTPKCGPRPQVPGAIYTPSVTGMTNPSSKRKNNQLTNCFRITNCPELEGIASFAAKHNHW